MRSKRNLIVAGLLLTGLIGGAAVAKAASSYTAPKDHAQAFVTQNSLGQWVVQRQVGFTNVQNPQAGVWCFTLPATANPSKSTPVVTANDNAGKGETSAQGLASDAILMMPGNTCSSGQIQVMTGYDIGGGPFSAGVTNESFTIVVP